MSTQNVEEARRDYHLTQALTHFWDPEFYDIFMFDEMFTNFKQGGVTSLQALLNLIIDTKILDDELRAGFYKKLKRAGLEMVSYQNMKNALTQLLLYYNQHYVAPQTKGSGLFKITLIERKIFPEYARQALHWWSYLADVHWRRFENEISRKRRFDMPPSPLSTLSYDLTPLRSNMPHLVALVANVRILLSIIDIAGEGKVRVIDGALEESFKNVLDESDVRRLTRDIENTHIRVKFLLYGNSILPTIKESMKRLELAFVFILNSDLNDNVENFLVRQQRRRTELVKTLNPNLPRFSTFVSTLELNTNPVD